MKKQFFARGKLLLSGEYAVLHGALAIALPVRLGQRLTVKNARGSDLVWEALDHEGEVWFDAQISLYDFSAVKTSDEEIAHRLKKILKSAARDNSEFLSTWSGFKVETQVDFPMEWGLGSSSTLISNVAQWAEINPFHLYFSVFKGSGYDVACAEADDAIRYQLGEESLHFEEIDFKPGFLSKVAFVYLGKKQNSESAVKIHGRKFRNKKAIIEKITSISEEIMKNKSHARFNELIDEHEDIISEVIGLPKVKEDKFLDFNGSIKSLGAWGGDFILASSDKGMDYMKKYFKQKNLSTFFPYKDLMVT